MAHLAGEIEGEVEVGGTANPDMVKVIQDLVLPGATAAGRSVDDLRISFNPMLVIDDDGAEAESLAIRTVAMYVAVAGAHDPTLDLDPDMLRRLNSFLEADDHEAAGNLLDSDTLRRFAVCGTPTEAVDHLLSLRDAGLDTVYLGNPFGLDETGGLELLCNRVIPAVRRG